MEPTAKGTNLMANEVEADTAIKLFAFSNAHPKIMFLLVQSV
jgi:Holliday junction resolvasome RuvABC DNA-binding subunit